MDHESLRTASTYLNNLLLARGLLRNSEPIDFVKPSKESRAQIINLVHDLILRDDRDIAGRENAAETLRALRADDHRKTHEIERLNGKVEEAARRSVTAQNAERTAKAEVQKVERSLKTLQDQVTKLKTALAQVKTQCANDVRKRDVELARLKTHLQGQQRGNRTGISGPSLVVKKLGEKSGGRQEANVADPEYSLKQETTEFLTQLSQSLSDENDSLIGLIRNALTTMRELLGLPVDGRRHPDSAIGSMGSGDETMGSDKHDMLHSSLPTSYEVLSRDMESALSHLKELLTTPNYVSMEEVEIREEEISRLRAGWDRMEQRWREVLQMMEGWRKRMDTGDTINIDEIRRGIGLVSPVGQYRKNGEMLLPVEPEQSFIGSDVSEIRIDGLPETSIVALSSPVAVASAVKGAASSKRKRDMIEPPNFFDLRPSSATSSSASSRLPRPTASRSVEQRPDVHIEEGAEEEEEANHLPLEDNDADLESEDLDLPEMTVSEKLSAAQAEAEEAAAAAAAAATSSSVKVVPRKSHNLANGKRDAAHDDDDNDDTLGKMPSPKIKRTKIRGRPRKRKSTLSPEELEALISAE